ncbi:MAG: histidinol-phosphate transaminase [Oscillospiraceae bacterium]|jgi:histidinol-phosphate aminotransferase|nr:histidinol-phosphate transaminase [Oscillospiraceae bacterium]
MSRFFSKTHANLTPYTPGEQPRGEKLIKLNTNESPFPPPQSVIAAIARVSSNLQLYSDPQGTELRAALAAYHGVAPEQISLGNGSDETLAFAFAAFGDAEHSFAFPDITYGFYPVFAALFKVPFTEIPLTDSFEIDFRDYLNLGKNIVIANPNAPTGITLPLGDIEQIIKSNPDNIVIIDEAYIDFAGEGASAVPLTARYDNLLVVRTFSKSRNLAGARLGYAVGNAALISDLETIRYSFNPYNINSLTLAAGAAALRENDYYAQNWAEIARTRSLTISGLRQAGLTVLPSAANFVFAKHPTLAGPDLLARLRERGFLVRNLGQPRIRDWLRITIGAAGDMEKLIETIKVIGG